MRKKKPNPRGKGAQLEFPKVKGWGGKRKGAGRKNRTSTVNHMARPRVDFKKPLHITLRLIDGIKSIRAPSVHTALKLCLIKAKAKGLRVIHYSIEGNHLHLFVEAKDNQHLALGMRSLGCSLGKAIRNFWGGRGAVFKGRYHLHVLKNPRETKNGLAYVLINQSKHEKLIPYNDRYSSAGHFSEWKELLGSAVGPILEDWQKIDRPLPPHLSGARSWLARQGWLRG